MTCWDGAALASALAVHYFDWADQGTLFQGAMVGLVTTHPAWRGQGCARLVLEYAHACMQHRGVDFGVLWTAQQAFYAKMGWQTMDTGVMGTFTSPFVEVYRSASPSLATTRLSVLAPTDVPAIESLRTAGLGGQKLRTPLDYASTPLPAQQVHLLAHGTPLQAYALVGSQGDSAYVYEFGGDPESFGPLWDAACQHWQQFVLNDKANSPSHQWFQTHTKVAWQPKPLAMWLPLSGRVSSSQCANWYLPYFDRI